MRANGPRSELLLRSDVAGAIRAVNAASAELAEVMPLHEVVVYRAGFHCALRAVALAFDLEIPEIPAQASAYRLRSGPGKLAEGIAG